jgi:N,N'-diacetyllegionaminate synthase
VEQVTLLHCTSNYPTAPGAVNLRAMQTLRERFGVRVGYSDHTQGILAATAAVALGACLIEKHFTLDRSLPGPDHPASLEPGELTEMVRQIRVVEQMLGSGEKKPAESELAVRDLVRRSIVTRRPILAGAVVRADDLELLRPGTGIGPQHLPRVIGRQAKAAIPQGAMLAWDQLET